MSEQSQKKPGSLRDRIAAFEKSSAAPAAAQSPPPRPKPAGFASWKPKPPSPPASPQVGSTEHAAPPSSAMSASDARESITKGASLRERMAALQNKGAFGSSPPPAPKPAVERPKWKPPPIVQAPDAESSCNDGASGIATAIEQTISPAPIKDEGNVIDESGSQSTVIPGEASETNPEEDDHQRRAAIAARMARLGGARLGMAPPILGKKPVRRSTQEEREATEDTKSQASQNVNRDSAARPSSPSVEPTNIASPPADAEGPLRRDSDTTSDINASKPPSSMPVPVVPRRTGPPRKKATRAAVTVAEIPNQEHPIPSPAVNKLEEPASLSEADQISTNLQAGESTNTKPLALNPTEKPDSEDQPKFMTKSEYSDSPSIYGGAPSAFEPASEMHSRTCHATEYTSDHKVGDEREGELQISSVCTPADAVLESATETESIHKDLIDDRLVRPGAVSPVIQSPYEGAGVDIARPDHNFDFDEADHGVDVDAPLLSDNNREVATLASQHSNFPLHSNSPLVDQPTENSSSQSTHSEVQSAQRSIYAQPPRDIVTQVSEEDEDRSDEEVDERLAQSHLFIPPPKERIASQPRHQNIQDEDDGAGDGSENDTPALPVPHRHSLDTSAAKPIHTAQSDNESDSDSDYDQALPVPPRPPRRSMPPAPAEGSPEYEDGKLFDAAKPPISMDAEVMDEEEGDPVDPQFYYPTRRSPYMNLSTPTAVQPVPQTSPLLSPPLSSLASQPQHVSPSVPGKNSLGPSDDDVQDTEGDDLELRRRTIAERMAKLGGIKFGSTPIPAHKPATTALRQGKTDETGVLPAGTGTGQEDGADTAEDKEDERERKERISAKLAQMGGMKIGMMPVGVTQRPIPQAEPKAVSHLSPDLPSRPPPPVPAHELEPGSGSVSDDGVKVEAEDSEVEEVNFQDAELEEVPPPLPSRSTRPVRRQDSIGTPSSPPSRIPVPIAPPPRRSSTQALVVGSATSSVSLQRRDSVPTTTQSDYVLVESTETQRHAPPTRYIPDVSEMDEGISSQWELPSIPIGNLDFGGSTDLSLSWTDAGESVPPQPPTTRASTVKPSGIERPMSADQLISVWGQVGVQLCEAATALFDKSKKALIGDGTYAGFVKAALKEVPNAAAQAINMGEYGYLVYYQHGGVVQKRASEIMPGDIIEVHDARFKGHKGLQAYQQSVADSGEPVIGIVGEFEAKKSKVKVFQANQHVGQQTVESVSYRLDDLKSGTVKIYRVLEA